MAGKVWLVGAGPGDPGLFTIKGRQVLENAEVVVYDALVGQGVLNMVPEAAELIDVGKRASNHKMCQDDINQVLAAKAREGKRVVRLKGGDPFLFGRGGEEVEVLAAAGLAYEIVPGITSAIAVPAYNGIPVTHRDFTSSVHIITGHKKAGESYNIDFEALVKTGGTLVFLMGIATLDDICKGLMANGMAAEMPAAVLQQGTTARQKRIVATVATLTAAVAEQGVETPAIIVVGRVCSLAEQFGWYEKLPLAGRKILVTRPKQLGSVMAARLRSKGAEVLELPAIRTEPIDPNPRLQECIAKLAEYTWVVFTSPTGVNVFFDELIRQHCDIRALAGCKIAVVGQGTAKILRDRGIFADLIPDRYDGAELGKMLAGQCHENDRVLIPRAAIGGPELVAELARVEGLQIDDVPAYDTFYKSQELIDQQAEFRQERIDFAVFTSASSVQGFAETVKDIDYSKVQAVCIGPQTKAAADQLGMTTYVAAAATIDSTIERVEALCRELTGGKTGEAGR